MKKTALILMMMLLLTPVIGSAQQKGGVELKSLAEVEKVQKDDKGVMVVTRVDAAKANVVPGDTVIYTITYLNNGDEAATGVVLSNPVPEHMLYLDRSAEGAGTSIDFSTNHGKTFSREDKVKVKQADGHERPASAADITMVRWTLEKPLLSGGKGGVSFRAKVK